MRGTLAFILGTIFGHYIMKYIAKYKLPDFIRVVFVIVSWTIFLCVVL